MFHLHSLAPHTMIETNKTTTTLHNKTWPPIIAEKKKGSSSTRSVTKEEIADYWRRKKTEEEDHMLAAIKAAARVVARNLSEEDYKKFEESLNEEGDNDKKDGAGIINTHNKKDEGSKEIRVGIKDWWTKSKYAYLNQPAIESMEKPKRRTPSTYTPISFTFYKPPPPQLSSFQVF